MPGRRDTRRGGAVSPREIRLVVDGEDVALNGYVQDVFQETIVALIRTLGTCDEAASIAITIAASESPDGTVDTRRSPERR